MSKRNITLALEEELLKDARVLAARRGISVSALLRLQLQKLIDQERGYVAARSAALRRLETGASLGGGKLPTREALHERG